MTEEKPRDLMAELRKSVDDAKRDSLIRALRSQLATREAELLELKGPCGNKQCRLHYAHSGPCDVAKAGQAATDRPIACAGATYIGARCYQDQPILTVECGGATWDVDHCGWLVENDIEPDGGWLDHADIPRLHAEHLAFSRAKAGQA